MTLSFQGLQFIAEAKEGSGAIDKSMISMSKTDLDNFSGEKGPTLTNRIHRTYPVGISLSRDIRGSDT